MAAADAVLVLSAPAHRRRAQRRVSWPTWPASWGRWSSPCTTRSVAAANVMAVYAVCVDALTRRMLELADARSGRCGRRVRLAGDGQPGPPRGAAQLGRRHRRSCGSSGDERRAVRDPPGGRRHERCSTGCSACGLRIDEHGVNASTPAFVRSVASWQRVARSWLEDPTQEKALDAVLGRGRQPSGVGRAYRHAGRRHVPPGPGPSRAAAPAGALRPRLSGRRPGFSAASWWSTPASIVDGWISSGAGLIPIVDAGALGRDVRGRDQRLDRRASARGRRRRNAVGGRRAHAGATRSR